MNVNDIVAEKIAAARARAEAAKRRRAALAAARQRGLAHRHAAKLRRQANRGDIPTADAAEAPTQPSGCSCGNAYACPHACWHCKAARGDGCEPWCHIRPFDPATPDDPGDIVTELTDAEWHDGVRNALHRLGLTYAELEDQAHRRDFTSAQAQVLWTSIGGTVNTQLLEEQ